MPAHLSDYQAACATAAALWLAAGLFVSALRFGGRLASVGVRARVIAVAVVTDPLLLYGLLWLGWLFLAALSAGSRHAPYTLVLEFAGIALVLLNLWNSRQTRRAQRYGVSRGELWKAVRVLCARARIMMASPRWGEPRFRLYVLPDDASPWAFSDRLTVFIRRRHLEAMSRAEIDALAARQITRLARHNLAAQLPLLGPVAAYGLAAGLFESLQVGLSAPWAALPILLAVEMAVLAACASRILLRDDLRATGLTGNPEAFFSAVAQAARLDGSSLNLPRLSGIAQRVGVSPDRLEALLRPSTGPAEGRYPTSGDYLTTGLPCPACPCDFNALE